MAYPVQRYAKKYGIPLPLANALVGQESGGVSSAVSSAGATGLTQVLPSTAAGMYGISEAQAAARLKNPSFALDAGFRYLAAQKKAFGSWRLALAAYNAGPNAVREFGGIPPYQETQDYVRNILGKAGTLQPTAAAGVGSSAGTGQAAASLPSPPKFDPTVLAQQNLADIARGSFSPVQALGALAQAKAQFDATAPQGAPAASKASGGTPVSFQLPKRLTKNVRNAVSLAQEYLGTPYVWGGEKPGGFDCSGLVQYVYAKQGINVPRTTYEQFQSGKAVRKSQLLPGDVVFFTGSDPKNGLPGHEGLYIGNGRFIEAPGSGKVVRISKLAGRSDFVGARRFK